MRKSVLVYLLQCLIVKLYHESSVTFRVFHYLIFYNPTVPAERKSSKELQTCPSICGQGVKIDSQMRQCDNIIHSEMKKKKLVCQLFLNPAYKKCKFMSSPSVPTIEMNEIFWNSFSFVISGDIHF